VTHSLLSLPAPNKSASSNSDRSLSLVLSVTGNDLQQMMTSWANMQTGASALLCDCKSSGLQCSMLHVFYA